jgi:hypothetical protein
MKQESCKGKTERELSPVLVGAQPKKARTSIRSTRLLVDVILRLG